MFQYKKEQKSFEIAGIKIGGLPTVLIGTIFYKEEKNRGDFSYMESLINKVLELSDKTDLPFIPDVYIDEGDDFQKTIDFISKFNLPFLVDAPLWKTRVQCMQFCKDAGLLDKAIYNSYNSAINEEEKEALTTLRPTNALLMAFNPMNTSVAGRIELVKKKLLPMVQLSGVKNVLLDTGAMPLGSGSLSSFKSLVALKSEFGLPTGSGIHNILSSIRNDLDKDAYRICDTCLIASLGMMGADFILFGPIESSERVFPAVKIVNDILKDG